MARRVRAVRRGMGKGQGKGYKNLAGKDPMVHSQSARGMKQPQRVNIPIQTKPKLTEEEKEAFEIFGDDFFKLRDNLISDYGKIENIREEEAGVWMIETEQDAEFFIFENEDRAEIFAEDRVREDLENEPELFLQSWLEQFMSMTDTDRRLIAQEESDNFVDEVLDDEEHIENSDYKDEYDEIQEEIEVYENRFEEGLSNKNEQKLQDKIDALEEKKGELIEKAKEEAREEKYDEIYDALEDPVNYFVDAQGIYTKEDLFKQSFISIDVDEATEDAVRTDGWQHFVATYDGDSIDVPDTDLVLARTN